MRSMPWRVAVLFALLGTSRCGGQIDSPPVTTTEDAGPGPEDSGFVDDATLDVGAGDAGTCKPATLHPATPGSLFCYAGDAGTLTCEPGEECCLGGPLGGGQYAPETCAPWGGPCNNPPVDKGIPIECEQTSDCAANDAGFASLCCLEGATLTQVFGCMDDYKAVGGTGAFCESPGTSGGCITPGALQICETQAECTMGQACRPIRWKLYEVGVCQ